MGDKIAIDIDALRNLADQINNVDQSLQTNSVFHDTSALVVTAWSRR